MVELSKRLQMLAHMVTPGNRVADIGCDHGFVSIYLIQRGISPKVYAMDVREGPLLQAREHIREWGLESYIETRLSDGVSKLQPGEAQTLVCAGMGGRLMQKILTEGQGIVKDIDELILQPQSEIAEFRRFLRQKNFQIVQEEMVYEEEKYYPMMKAVPGGRERGAVTLFSKAENVRLEDKFGAFLIKNRDPALMQYLRENIGIYESIQKQIQASHGSAGREARESRLKEIAIEVSDMKKVLSGMENI